MQAERAVGTLQLVHSGTGAFQPGISHSDDSDQMLSYTWLTVPVAVAVVSVESPNPISCKFTAIFGT